MKKLVLLTAGAAGYVLGARAGRERYDQIRDAAVAMSRNPKVQSVVDDVKTEASTAAREAAGKVADATHRDSGTTP